LRVGLLIRHEHNNNVTIDEDGAIYWVNLPF